MRDLSYKPVLTQVEWDVDDDDDEHIAAAADLGESGTT
jgi:hypothetical protein